jgi:hypothetical protein
MSVTLQLPDTLDYLSEGGNALLKDVSGAVMGFDAKQAAFDSFRKHDNSSLADAGRLPIIGPDLLLVSCHDLTLPDLP